MCITDILHPIDYLSLLLNVNNIVMDIIIILSDIYYHIDGHLLQGPHPGSHLCLFKFFSTYHNAWSTCDQHISAL